MAIRQRKAPAAKPAPVEEQISSAESEAEMEQLEYHTEPSENDEEADEEAPAEYHTDPEDEEASDADDIPPSTIPLLPTALLKSQPTAPTPPGTRIDWDTMTRTEKKALRDDLGVSMRELREEAQRNGLIDAGKMAQLKRGIRPAEKVAGGRVAKRKNNRRRKGEKERTAVSGRQKLVEERKRSARGTGREVVRKRKG